MIQISARDAPDSRPHFGDTDISDGTPGASPPQDIPPTCGQNVHNSQGGKLRQDDEKARPSERLRRDDEAPPPGDDAAAPDGKPAADSGGGDAPGSGGAPDNGPRPGGKKAAREARRYEKSGRRVEKTGAKLDNARDKLAAQKPPKRPGPVKTVGRAAGRQVHGYVHKKIYQVEHENVGTEAAHKVELAGESVIRGGTRLIKRRIRTRPARRVRKWERKDIKARADHTFRSLAREHPELNKNALSRYWQKRKIQKQYQKQAREAAKKTASVTKKIIGAVFRFIRSNPKIIMLAACVFLLIVLLQSCMGAMLSIGNGIAGAIGGTSYLAEDGDINQAELAYSEWEADLTLEARNAAQSHPGYDEYRFDIDPTGHDPHALLAFLTAKYDDFTFAQVEPVLRDIFNQQYDLTFTEIVEVRYRTEYYTCENGHEHSYQVPYNYYILEVTLTARPFADVIGPLLTEQDEQDRYDVYNVTKGNRQYVGSPFPFNWLPYVSSTFGYRVHPISGEKDFHTGVDIALPTGTEIQAGGEGVVLSAGSAGDYGLAVVIDYGEGVTARYAHCDALLVSAGQTVQAGDVIARVGSTGNSTGPHVHVEVIKDGERLNPLYFLVIPFD